MTPHPPPLRAFDDDPFFGDLAAMKPAIRAEYVREPNPDVRYAHLEAIFAASDAAAEAAAGHPSRVRKAAVVSGVAGATLFGSMGLAAAGVLPESVQRGLAGVVRPLGVQFGEPTTPASPTSVSGGGSGGSDGGGNNNGDGKTGGTGEAPAPNVAGGPPSSEDNSAGNGESENAPGHGSVDPAVSGSAPDHDGADPGNDAPGAASSNPDDGTDKTPTTKAKTPHEETDVSESPTTTVVTTTMPGKVEDAQ